MWQLELLLLVRLVLRVLLLLSYADRILSVFLLEHVAEVGVSDN